MLPMSIVYKVVMIKRMYNILQENNIAKGPTANIITICRRYNLLWTVIEAVESGVYMTKAEWKRCLKDAVLVSDYKRPQITCRMYKSLIHVHFDGTFSMSGW